MNWQHRPFNVVSHLNSLAGKSFAQIAALKSKNETVLTAPPQPAPADGKR
jgi:hypothetical protein